MFSLLEGPQALNKKSNLKKPNWGKKQKQINRGPQEKNLRSKLKMKKKPADKNYKKQDSSQFNLGWVCG